MPAQTGRHPVGCGDFIIRIQAQLHSGEDGLRHPRVEVMRALGFHRTFWVVKAAFEVLAELLNVVCEIDSSGGGVKYLAYPACSVVLSVALKMGVHAGFKLRFRDEGVRDIHPRAKVTVHFDVYFPFVLQVGAVQVTPFGIIVPDQKARTALLQYRSQKPSWSCPRWPFGRWLGIRRATCDPGSNRSWHPPAHVGKHHCDPPGSPRR